MIKADGLTVRFCLLSIVNALAVLVGCFVCRCDADREVEDGSVDLYQLKGQMGYTARHEDHSALGDTVGLAAHGEFNDTAEILRIFGVAAEKAQQFIIGVGVLIRENGVIHCMMIPGGIHLKCTGNDVVIDPADSGTKLLITLQKLC